MTRRDRFILGLLIYLDGLLSRRFTVVMYDHEAGRNGGYVYPKWARDHG